MLPRSINGRRRRKVEEDTTDDSEAGHTSEGASYLALEGIGTLAAQATYHQRLLYDAGDSVAPLWFPDCAIDVAPLFP